MGNSQNKTAPSEASTPRVTDQQPQSGNWAEAKGGKEDEPPVDYQGPTRDRNCTDVVCLLLFCAFLVAWAIVAFYAAING